GGVKVLITGPWQEASSNYSCLFDQISVPASLIQPGVLRCYCPAHDTGLVTLQVAISNQIISSSVVFEYKARALPSLPSSQHDWLSLDAACLPALICHNAEWGKGRFFSAALQVRSHRQDRKALGAAELLPHEVPNPRFSDPSNSSSSRIRALLRDVLTVSD
ncbi:hypothetical protein XENORESO_006666, partial [Xenotaenia resolanae]